MMTPFIERRRKLLQQIGNDGIAILFAAPEQRRSNDTTFPFRQDSYFHYLTGFPEPESVLVLDGAAQTATLYCRDKDPLRETWEGFRYGPEAAREAFGLDAAYSISRWHEDLEKLLLNKSRLYALWGVYPEHDRLLMQAWGRVRQYAGQRIQLNTYAPDALGDVSEILDAMRLVKDGHELALLEEAGEISAKAHIRAMQKTRPGVSELQIEAELLHEFMRHGARFPAYNSIVAGGKNACCLHYVENKDVLNDGELLLIDAGAEYQGYAGDISRTFPVNGKFNAAQKDLYEVVLAANEAAIAAVKPGADWRDLHQMTLRILVQGMVDFKLLQGTVDGNIESMAYQRYYMHGLGHWVGLDVHDVGGRWQNGEPILLRPGMCTTIEPGIYVNAADDIPEAFHNIGIRIEDNVYVTETGCKVYTTSVPKSVADIEDIMRG
ncbi:aminopeptidase P N-terminal domain-containing protein [Neisseria montereyensis]|uniref:Xaa-Pro aminopeptidase n=1 Tax=Neisseria montereyensis TaxID=2973938 RepID=A0ABT2FDH5_9NEIS|nr:aminopeptidase P N-terminal domain-containing protein [Neisseria montereyensis]MCS4533568.1 aminopeptidase P N-terminal domain-containing protein [Neisseria montereyensis]